MAEQRRIERQQLSHYLQVFNCNTGKPVGSIGNISPEGLMLVSQLPMLVGARFDLRLTIPGEDGQEYFIDFAADCLWCREDVTPGTFDSGFFLLEPPEDYLQMVAALHDYFSFVPQATS
jgi:hypothetical protein